MVSGFDPKKGDINGVYVKLSADADTQAKIHVKALGDLDTVTHFDTIYTGEALVPAGENWVYFPLQIKIDPEKFLDGSYLQIWMEPTEGVSWRSVEKLSNYHRAGVRQENGQWKWQGGVRLQYSLGVPKEIIADCRPENVINGHSRILSAAEYEWVSDPGECLPQWLQVEFKETAEIGWVSLVFDTDMSNPGTCSLNKYPAVETCVKDYYVEVFDGKTWIKVGEEAGNFMRKRTFRFDTVAAEKIRVTVTATNGDASARITEIRAGK